MRGWAISSHVGPCASWTACATLACIHQPFCLFTPDRIEADMLVPSDASMDTQHHALSKTVRVSRSSSGEVATPWPYRGEDRGAASCLFSDQNESAHEGQDFLLPFSVDMALVDRTRATSNFQACSPHFSLKAGRVITIKTRKPKSSLTLNALAARLMWITQMYEVMPGEVAGTRAAGDCA